MAGRHRTTICLSVLAYVFCFMPLRAQESDTTKNNFPRAGSWALQFQITSNFNLTSFQGAIVSAKFHLSSDAAIRVGIGGAVYTRDIDQKESSSRADTSYVDRTRTDSDDNPRIEANIQYLWYVNPAGDAKLFCGAGLAASYFWEKRNIVDRSATTGLPVEDVSQIRKTTAYYAGPTGVAGVEYFATRWLSIHAEYGLSVLYNYRKQTTTQTSGVSQPTRATISSTEKTWSVTPASVKFGISVYI